MPLDYIVEIAAELKLDEKGVFATIALLDDQATVPFIARYRKERTGNLDEEQIMAIRDRLSYLRKLEERKQTILKTIEEQGKLTDELRERIEATRDATQLEDLYLPYKPKRKTRATVAIEKGLEPLADLIWKQERIEGDLAQLAAPYVNPESDVPDAEAAWAGARDIVAERISETAEIREELRDLFINKATVLSKVKKDKEKAGEKYKDYFDFEESVRTIPSHRMLAVRRGETEGFLSLRIVVEEADALGIVRKRVLRGDGGSLFDQLDAACVDGYNRLLAPSIEGFARNELRKRADEEAIYVFAKNLRELLLAPPLGGKWVLAVDPGIRTGCKIVALDDKGDLLASTVIFPLGSEHEQEKAAAMVETYCQRYRIEAVAIGNGTGGRETERFFRKMGRDRLNDADIILVNESGASVYSASDVARKEFPDQDITVRGSISIGRRLQDPLAELVKIDPKSIGVGQYQHDVDQDLLKQSLDDVVVSCVNAVGVELNTASAELLQYVSGLNASQAQNIISFRRQNGQFKNRKQLLEVPKLGPKTFEQAAGFLRIRGSDNPLDASAVHPERYELVARMAEDLGVNLSTLIDSADTRRQIDIHKYISDDVGEPTLKDILAELERPGRDPRPPLEPVRFDPKVNEIKDLEEGMVLEGVVTNVTNFGAFVDIGVHQDGLVHVSELSHEFITDPSKVVLVGQRVKVKVLEVDKGRTRISLSIKQTSEPPDRGPRPPRKPVDRPRPEQKRTETKSPVRDRRPAPPPRQDRPAAYNPFAALKMQGGKIVLSEDVGDKDEKKKAAPVQAVEVDPETGLSKNAMKKKKKLKKKKK